MPRSGIGRRLGGKEMIEEIGDRCGAATAADKRQGDKETGRQGEITDTLPIPCLSLFPLHLACDRHD
jgi:hypothetical protein